MCISARSIIPFRSRINDYELPKYFLVFTHSNDVNQEKALSAYHVFKFGSLTNLTMSVFDVIPYITT